MIKHMFVFGVIIPTAITIFLFISFLVCWFKFNMRERLFAKKKFFSKQLKHAMAAHQSGGSKQSHYTPDQTSGPAGSTSTKRDHSGRDHSGGASCINVPSIKPKKQKHYENCQDHENYVGEDPEAALCTACEDEHNSGLEGFTNPNLCVSPSHSADGGDEQTETEDHSDNESECVHVKKVGSMIQHTFHFPASEGPHLSNSLVVDSEDGGSEDGNYGHFVPLSQLLLDPKAKQFYAAARNDTDSPCAELADGVQSGGTEASSSIA